MSADLKKCETANCNPQWQIRGEMKHEDYVGLIGADLSGGDYKEETHDGNRYDIRISCKTCGLTSGWNMKDAPGAPGALQDYEIKKWSETIDEKVNREHMLADLETKYGKEALRKHFGKSL